MATRGKVLLTLLILGVLGVALWNWYPELSGGGRAADPAKSGTAPAAPPSPPQAPAAGGTGQAPAAKPPLPSPEIVEPATEVPQLAAAAAYQVKGDVFEIELSEYAGYAGLVAANGGLEPNPDSVFAKKHGFRVKFTLSEEESWSALISGKLAASATTVDVLAVYGKQFDVVVPALIGYSRGADGIVVRSDVKSVNALKGRTLATVQFTEAEFFIRYLAATAGIPVNALAGLATPPEPDALNLVFVEESPKQAEVFLRHVKADHPALAGFVGWAPDTTEAVEASGGKARMLTTNANLLIVADILVVNRGLAQQRPDFVAGLVSGLLEGNRMVRDHPDSCLDVVGRAMGWDREKTRHHVGQVHFANLPENTAFFAGSMIDAGSYGDLFQSAVYSYGTAMVRTRIDPARFVDLAGVKEAEKSGAFKDQSVAIAPKRAKGTILVEKDPLLSKNIRFLFKPMAAVLDAQGEDNRKNIEDVKGLLRVSPGCQLLIRGHVDNSSIEELRKKGGEDLVRRAAAQAVELSQQRAETIKRVLVESHGFDPGRLNTMGCGWDEPLGADAEQNRRVEVQWITIESDDGR